MTAEIVLGKMSLKKVLSSSFHLCVDPNLYTVVVIVVVFEDKTVHSGLSKLHKTQKCAVFHFWSWIYVIMK